jgi:hypothetical protein
MNLVSVTLFLGKSKLSVIVEAPEGKRRKIDFHWFQKEHPMRLPTDWLESVRGEVNYRLSIENNPKRVEDLR